MTRGANPGLAAASAAELGPVSRSGSRGLRFGIRGDRVFGAFLLSTTAVNLAALLGHALALRWVDPASMGVWHALLLLNSYLTFLRLGLVSGMGRELPFALGRGDYGRAGRITATVLGWSAVCSALVATAFLALLLAPWTRGAAWQVALPAMAVVSGATFYLGYLQATLRSDADFGQLARTQWLQAGTGLLMPLAAAAFGFPGLAAHAALQALLVTGCAHAWRPFRVAPRFERAVARGLLAAGLPLFLSGYLQNVALGFDRVILLERGGVTTLGHYAPAVAALSAMAIVPGAVASYVYPRMSYALGQGCSAREVRAMAVKAAALSMAAGLPALLIGWLAAPAVIARFFPAYLAAVPAVRWSLLAGCLTGLSPAVQALGSLKAWRRLAAYVALLLAARWTFPWLLSGRMDPLEGVALGNVCAAAATGALALGLLLVAGAAPRTEEPPA